MKPTWNQRLRGIIGSQFGADVVEQNLEKAVIAAQQMAKTGAKPMTHFYSPYAMFMGREWLVKSGTALTYQDLRMMAKNPIIGSIVNTRLNQVAAFCQPSHGGYDAGFEIVPNDSGKESSKAKDDLTSFVATAGMVGYGENHLEEFARKFIRDSLILDQGCAEVVFRQNEAPAYMVVADGSTIRRLLAAQKFSTEKTKPIYVQTIDEVIVAEYTRDQLIFGVRNPSTDIMLNGYGSSELEILVNVVTIMANAEKYNSSALAQGGTQKGILVVKGAVDQPQLESFKRDFREAISNAAVSWRPPVLGVGSEAMVDWVTLDRSNKDMEYAQLFEFIIKLATGVYQISPDEVNWSVGQAGTSVTYNSGQKDRLAYSQDKGLRPLLNFFAGHLNASFVHKIDPNMSLKFTGLGVSREDEAELRTKEVSSYKTVNEIREEASLPSLGAAGDIILNPVFAQSQAPAAPMAGSAPKPVVKEQKKSPSKLDPGEGKKLSLVKGLDFEMVSNEWDINAD